MSKGYLPLAITRCGSTEFHRGERTYIIGIINMSPDSFSGDGLGSDVTTALKQAKRFTAEGTDIIDVGGESTRPESQPITADEELPPDQRLEGTAATVAIGIANGADIIRVHDVLQMARVCRMSDAIVRGGPHER